MIVVLDPNVNKATKILLEVREKDETNYYKGNNKKSAIPFDMQLRGSVGQVLSCLTSDSSSSHACFCVTICLSSIQPFGYACGSS